MAAAAASGSRTCVVYSRIDECCHWTVEEPFFEGMASNRMVSMQEIKVEHSEMYNLFIHGMAHASPTANVQHVWLCIQATLGVGWIEV